MFCVGGSVQFFRLLIRNIHVRECDEACTAKHTGRNGLILKSCEFHSNENGIVIAIGISTLM